MIVEGYMFTKLYEEYKKLQTIEMYYTARAVSVEEANKARTLLALYTILYILLIGLYIAGVITAFTKVRPDKKVLAVVIAVFMPFPFFWVLYLAGAFN